MQNHKRSASSFLVSQASLYQESLEHLKVGQPSLTICSSTQLVQIILLTDSHSTMEISKLVNKDKLKKEWQDAQALLKTYPSMKEKVDLEANPYPRHFGVTFSERDDFESFVEHLKENNVDFLHPLTTRFEGLPEVHSTFFLKDPSNNVLEFKFYPNKEMMH